MKSFLIVQQGKAAGQRYDLDTTYLTIGSAADNDLVLDDALVSHYHAAVMGLGSAFLIVDLGSANPVKVNDRILHAHAAQQLRDADVIRIGATEITFQSGRDESSDQVQHLPPETQQPVAAPETAPAPPAQDQDHEQARREPVQDQDQQQAGQELVAAASREVDDGNRPPILHLCPYLGAHFDRETRATFPSLMHRCWRTGKAVPVADAYQDEVCLTDSCVHCPRFIDAAAAIPRPQRR